MTLKLITPAVALAVSLAEAKLHLRVDVLEDDALITALITAATEMAEQATGRAIMPQTWLLALDSLPATQFELTRIPVQSVTSIMYADASGVDQTWAVANYAVKSDDYAPTTIVLAYGKNWPVSRSQADAVRVTYVAGYANAAAVPESIKAWIKLMVGAMYENREAETVGSGSAIKLGFADRLLDRYKVWAL